MAETIPDAVRAKVRTPAICLIILAILGLLFGLLQAAGLARISHRASPLLGIFGSDREIWRVGVHASG